MQWRRWGTSGTWLPDLDSNQGPADTAQRLRAAAATAELPSQREPNHDRRHALVEPGRPQHGDAPDRIEVAGERRARPIDFGLTAPVLGSALGQWHIATQSATAPSRSHPDNTHEATSAGTAFPARCDTPSVGNGFR